MVSLDRERIFQVLSNLLGNAVKFTPEGGQVMLSATVEVDRLLVAVTDTGPGVAESDVPRLFDRFWRVPVKNKAGTGLGLYIAKGIVEGHGGRIWVERPGSGGASFRFTLPLAPAPG
jgi:signal transduction histidine kinase